jgi:predicted SAM-dependent methyltransferase
MIKLNLGCGTNSYKDYINIDKKDYDNCDLVCDILNLPFKEERVDEIKAIHSLEHLDPDDALSHWYKLLKKGGKLVIEVPNLEKIIKQSYNDFEEVVKRIFGLRRYKGDSHIFGYNEKTLKDWLEKYNFKVLEMGEGNSEGHTPELCIKCIAEK